MSTPTVTRWRRYGKDRLYATTADGVKLGWVDLLTGQHYPEDPNRSAELADAVSAWRLTAAEPPTAPGQPDLGVLHEAPLTDEPPAL